MTKTATIFVCSSCQYKSSRWQGKCPECGEWNTLEERREIVRSGGGAGIRTTAIDLSVLKASISERLKSGISEFDEVLGGGLVPGSLVLLGGDPGIGKSTLALQVVMNLSSADVLYVSGEESAAQIKLRSGRIKINTALQVLCETDLASVLDFIQTAKPKLVVVDSIQTMYSAEASGVAGGVAQVTFAVQQIMRLAKTLHITFLIIGHVTKEGYLAGPKTLEHMVDTVLYLEGERFATYRVLRCVKNRFGTTNEVGVFEMLPHGLVEVKNPSQLFLGEDSIAASGNVVTSIMEGSRALLLEIQALTSTSNFGYPKRTTAGFDNNRLQLLCAILGKRAGLNLSNQDIYVNVVGGIKIEEPGADLAVAVAIVSSVKDVVLKNVTVVGELGLSGEVRFIPNLEKRIKEAEKLGFKQIICPKARVIPKSRIEVLQVRTLQEALRFV